MSRLIDITGRRFGKLVVRERAARDPHDKHTKWVCDCDCGGESSVTYINLKSGNTASCGCNRKPHGQSGSSTWRCWHSMMMRCVWKSDSPRYQGRVKVCDKWHDYRLFLEDVGERPSLAFSLDRIDNEGHYEPGNVRWATAKEQARNRSSNSWINVRGTQKIITDWAEICGISVTSVRRYMKRNGSLDGHPKLLALGY